MDDGYLVSREALLRLGAGDIAAGRRALRMLIDLECSHTPIEGPTAKPDDVRAATVADESAVLELLRLDLQENAVHIAPISEARLLEFVQHATRDRHATIGVVDGPGYLVGMIYLAQCRWFWADTWYIEERLTTVHPHHRNSRGAAALLQFGKWFVDEMTKRAGCRVVLTGSVMATRRALPKQVLFNRHLNRIGSCYAYPSVALDGSSL